ncbi:proteinase [Marmoricola endophyticus]|uniref:Proteinase n=1 Tax=Marmoricola endophyticus TaxID=2040280 RepID=A0A917BKR9_9ACTN|nr:alpha/beta hydrolase [Marmoricola endophyticus]GGF49675.1 proteinase [Marmoricola endophyticus]
MSDTGWTPATPPPAPEEPTRRRRPWLPIVVVGVLVVALVAAGAYAVVALRSDDPTSSTTATREPRGAMPSAPAGLSTYYDQAADWKACGSGNQCATVTVPLDYAAPDAKTIRLALVKVPASGKKIGSLVVNPGGPGGSGLDYASAGSAAWPEPLLQHYDLIGFDPRGVGKSTPLRCMDTAETDRYVGTDPDPDTPAEQQTFTALTKGFGDDCLEESGDLARHVSTSEVVKDLDVIRAVLDEPNLDYFGASYGTTIGAQYANEFPTHVGRMVLDGAISQDLTNEDLNLGQAGGFETALRAYVKDCVAGGDCVLGDSVEAGTTRVRDLIHSVEDKPLPTALNGRKLEAGNALYGVFFPLYVQQYWPLLTQALTQALNGDGTGLLTLSDQYTGRGQNSYKDNSTQVLPAVNCLDDDSGVPVSKVPDYFGEFRKASPTFGEVFAYSLAGCDAWPIKPVQGQQLGPVTAKGAPPIVVVGTTRDPATPYRWAVSLSKELESGVLVSRDGDGHTGFNRGNSCVDDTVEGYLLDGKVPEDGVRC